MIVLIGGEKGGTGKSTIATNLAAYLAGRGADVILLDSDQQSTAARWVERRNQNHPHLPKVHCVQKAGNLFETIRDLASRYQQVLIDAGAPMLDETPRPGAHDTKVAFVHPKFLGGVLAELVQDP